MFKRSLIVAALALTQTLSASPYDYEISPMGGINIPEGNLRLKNQWVLGGELMFNNLGSSVIKPELSAFFSPKTDYKQSTKETSIWRFALNGVYEYDKWSSFIPFAKAGLGYENMHNPEYGNLNSMFVDLGAGWKLPVTDNFAIKGEAIYMLKDNLTRHDSNLMLLIGFNYAFGEAEQKAAPVQEPVPVEEAPVEEAVVAVVILDGDDDGVVDADDRCPNTPADAVVGEDGCQLDSDGDGVVDGMDQCADTPAGIAVDSYGCPMDSDGDGVYDTYDQCPNTPNGFKVTEEGCAKTFKLDVDFKTNSAELNSANMTQIDAFVAFMKANQYDAEIVGRTDNTGAASYNRSLSLKRAEAVMNMMIDKGIAAKRLKAVGKGEDDPLASNDTAEGRAKNRSVRAELVR